MKDDKVKKLADKLYDQLVEEGWKNVSMERQLERATEYYRIDALVKNCDLGDVGGSYRYLQEGERIMPGDEFIDEEREWKLSGMFDERYNAKNHFLHRRPK